MCAVTHQWSFTKQFASSDQIANGDVKVGVSAAPVGDLCEGVGGQDVLAEKREGLWLLLDIQNPRPTGFTGTDLCLRVNQADSMLVYGDQQDLWKVGLCGLLNTKDTMKLVGNNTLICEEEIWNKTA